MKNERTLGVIVGMCICVSLSSCQGQSHSSWEATSAALPAGDESETASVDLYRQGVQALQERDLENAHERLKAAVTTDERNAFAWMELGIVEYERDNLLEAAYAFHRAALLEPSRYEPHYNTGMILESVGRYEKAIEAYSKALKLAPGQVEVMENLARCYIKTNTKLDTAEALVKKALPLEHRPEWREWLETQSRRLQLQGDRNQ